MSSIGPCESKTQDELDFPIGWFSVARGRDIGKGEVQRVCAFGRELALFRSREGKVVVLDAFCPHLGAHLGVEGRVVGETLRCPFHGWRFGADGVCVEIPYCDEVPERAQVRSWPVSETNGDIMVWYHPNEAAPAWEVPLVEELDSEEWTDPQYWEVTIPNHVQNIAENTCDPVHFQFVHKMPDTPPSEITVADDGRVLKLVAEAADAVPPNTLTVFMHNPGLAIVRTSYGPGAEMLVYSTAQPTSRNETLMRWSLTVRKEIVDLVGDDVMRGIKDGIDDDYPIWQHKIYRAKPVFCKADQSLVGFRKWVRQFYVD
jgi:phenylpropionate dioxygenase-like ring-hydroxylating dioxygenase large terminal subunit